MQINFYPEQYARDAKTTINHNYLTDQFSDYELILEKISHVVKKGDFTLGDAVDKFESAFAANLGAKYAIGLNSGTDALRLSLLAQGIKPGDEVITTAFTFFATIGAIVTVGAKPIFVDIGNDFNIDPSKIEEKITSKTRAILPVHWSGRPCDMQKINSIAKSYNLKIIEDACHAINAKYFDHKIGASSDSACFSMHPLKNLNVWGDGGIVVTNSETIANKLRLIRNHGLQNRDICLEFSFNSRLDTIQAVVAQHLLTKIDHITSSRIKNANSLDRLLTEIPEINLPPRSPNLVEVFHIYSFTCSDRDNLKNYLISKGIDAKIHYPIPMHLQPAASYLGHKAGDFPVAEKVANTTLSLPVHEFITEQEIDYMANCIRNFYLKK